MTGHAVVLTGYQWNCLRLMNSWGQKWADNGFFRIKNSEVLKLVFHDVFWDLKIRLRHKLTILSSMESREQKISLKSLSD